MMNRILLSMMMMMVIATVAEAQRVVISGRVLDFEGKPLAKANLLLLRPSQSTPIAMVEAAEDGTYKFATDEKGLAILQYIGVDHEPYSIGMFLDDSIHTTIDVRLQPHRYRSTIDSVMAIGDFNNFSYETAIPLARLADGCYELELPSNAKSVSYQLIGITAEGAVNAPQAAGYKFDGNAGYHAIASVEKGRVKITLDPMLLNRTKRKASALFENERMGTIARLYGDILRRRDAYQQALTENRLAGKSLNEFKYSWAKDLNRLSKQLAQEEDSIIQGMLLISYLELGTLGATRELRPGTAKWAFKKIPATSSLWSINPRLIMLAAERSQEPDSVYQSYIAEVIDRHGDPYVKAMLLYDGLTTAYTTKQEEKAHELYERLTTEYSNSRFAAMARAQFAFGH